MTSSGFGVRGSGLTLPVIKSLPWATPIPFRESSFKTEENPTPTQLVSCTALMSVSRKGGGEWPGVFFLSPPQEIEVERYSGERKAVLEEGGKDVLRGNLLEGNFFRGGGGGESFAGKKGSFFSYPGKIVWKEFNSVCFGGEEGGE